MWFILIIFIKIEGDIRTLNEENLKLNQTMQIAETNMETLNKRNNENFRRTDEQLLENKNSFGKSYGYGVKKPIDQTFLSLSILTKKLYFSITYFKGLLNQIIIEI